MGFYQIHESKIELLELLQLCLATGFVFIIQEPHVFGGIGGVVIVGYAFQSVTKEL